MQAIQHYGFYIVAFVVALGALVAFHEFGHFWVARRAGVKVLKFSIGFGPKIAGRQIGETEYLLSAIPLGGYVKMLGEDSGEEISEADKQRSFSHAPLYKRFAIVAAGPVFNLLLAYLIFTAWLATGAPLFVPSFADLAPTVETVVAGSPAEAGGMKSGDKIVQIADKRINTWNEMTEIVKKSPGKTLPLLIERDGRTERLTILPGSRKETQPDGTEIEAYYRETFLPEYARRGKGAPPALREVESQIREILVQKKIDDELSSWLKELRSTHKVKLH